jgi:hypothetical protein
VDFVLLNVKPDIPRLDNIIAGPGTEDGDLKLLMPQLA